MYIRDINMRRLSGLTRWATAAMTSVLLRGRERFNTDKREGNVTTETETGVIWPQPRKLAATRGWKRQEQSSPRASGGPWLPKP